jgi:branched-chain amino acid aminotransferase
MVGSPGREERVVERRIWIDERLVPWGEATIHLLAHSAARGSLVFDYMSVHETDRGPAIFRLGDHVDRFLQSVELVGLPLRRGRSELRQACLEAVRANPGARVVKLHAYLPSIEVDVVPVDDHVAVAAAAYDPWRDVLARKEQPPPKPPATLKIWIEKERRQRRPDILHPHAKVAANYTSPMVAKWRARRQGYDEVLLTDADGNLAEGPTTNVFLVDAEGVLRTPPEEGVLLGITRRSILEIARHHGLRVVDDQPIPASALGLAREAFLTGTSAGVWPIESVDGKRVGEGAPGPLSARLARHFTEITSGRDPAFAHWLTHTGA